jgi:hypothetical protein
MIDLNDNVISKEHYDTISNLLDGTDFEGVDYDKDKSLFNYGFVFDSRSNLLISTHSMNVWNTKDCLMHFGIVELTMDSVDEVYKENSEQILSDNLITPEEWEELCDSYKINLVENSTGGLNLKGMNMDITSEKLIEFLLTKID